MTRKKALLVSYEKGYRITDDGKILNPKGKEVKGRIRVNKKCGYKTHVFSVKVPNGCTQSINVHRLVAYQKFGNKMFENGILVRHLDGNSLNNKKENIEIGSQHQNMMDRPKLERQINASKQNRKHSNELIEEIRNLYNNGMSYKQIREQYNLPKSTLSYYLSKTAKRTSFMNPL